MARYVVAGNQVTDDFLSENANQELVDPDAGTLVLTIKDPAGDIVLTVPSVDLVRLAQGHYAYTWQTESSFATDAWTWNWDYELQGVVMPTAVAEVLVLPVGSGLPSGLLDVAGLRAALGGDTKLDDTSLQLLLDAAAAALSARWGPSVGQITDRCRPFGRVIILRRPASSVLSVTEVYGPTTRLLVSSDWALRSSGQSLLRLPVGYFWPADLVDVVYAPIDDTPERKRIQLAMIKLDLAYSGLTSQTDGSHSESQSATYSDERRRLVESYALPAVP